MDEYGSILDQTPQECEQNRLLSSKMNWLPLSEMNLRAMDTNDFYIGWQAKAPRSIGAHVRSIVVGLLVLVVVAAVIFVLAQRTIGTAVFEWGTLKTFRGFLKASPYPH